MLIFITLPDYDNVTRYLSAWSKNILLPTAERVGITPKISEGKNVTKSYITKNIPLKNPNFIFFNGHGSSTHIEGHNKEIIISLGDNDYLLKDRIVHVLACDAGKELGKKCDAKAFIGYKGRFWLCMDRFSLCKPLKDMFAAPILDSALEAPNQLLKGRKPGEAFEMSHQKYQKWINEFTHSESKYTTEELELILPILYINKSLLVLHEK